jgi:hypothetical protein
MIMFLMKKRCNFPLTTPLLPSPSPHLPPLSLSQSRCALLRPDNSNKLQMSIVSPFGYSDEDIDLSMIDVQENLLESLQNETEITTSHQRRGSFTTQQHQQHAALDEMRIYENIAKILKSFQKKTLTSSEMQTLEHRVWMNLSTLKELSVILRSMILIEEFEIKSFNTTCRHNVSEFTSFFSIQFHRNLCRLLEDVIYNRQEYIATATAVETEKQTSGGITTSNPSTLLSSTNANLHQYVQARSDLLKAYDMLIEINSQISLSSTAPPGTENNKWGKQNNARAEAICWAARRLAPSSLTPTNQRLQSTSSSLSPFLNAPSPAVSLLIRSSSLQASSDSQSGGAGAGELNSNTTPLTILSHHVESGQIMEKFQETMSVSSANSSTVSSPASIHTSTQRTHSSSSSPPPPPSLHLTAMDSFSNSTPSAPRLLPVSTFLLFHHCLASKIFYTSQKSNSDNGGDGGGGVGGATGGSATGGDVKDGDYAFAYDEFTILLDVNEGYLPPVHHQSQEDGGPHDPIDQQQHLVLYFSHPKVGREMLAFLFKSLLGDVFGLQKFSSSLEIMKLGDGFALRKSLPLMMAFMEAQSMSIVFNALVNRQMSVSPLQRSVFISSSLPLSICPSLPLSLNGSLDGSVTLC